MFFPHAEVETGIPKLFLSERAPRVSARFQNTVYIVGDMEDTPWDFINGHPAFHEHTSDGDTQDRLVRDGKRDGARLFVFGYIADPLIPDEKHEVTMHAFNLRYPTYTFHFLLPSPVPSVSTKNNRRSGCSSSSPLVSNHM